MAARRLSALVSAAALVAGLVTVATLLLPHGWCGRERAPAVPDLDDAVPLAPRTWPQEAHDALPTVYAVTPTYARLSQKADLTRMANTLRLVPWLHWIVVEDAAEKSPLVAGVLFRSGVAHTHLHVQSEPRGAGVPRHKEHRGVKQRNGAIHHLRWQFRGARAAVPGVVYFADDDNAYDVRVFERMRSTRLLRVWSVGLVGGLRYEGPIVDPTGRVVRWRAAWRPERPLPLDMAGLAVSLDALLKRPGAAFSASSRLGYLESDFAQHFIAAGADAETVPGGETEVLVWHTRTETPDIRRESALREPVTLEV
jgi:galactosylgalactosylxylosylprotein 3-beta-glucuronosyltransferase 3